MPYDELDLLLGQMFIFGFHGLIVDRPLADWYRKRPVGGIILFERNCQNKDQIQALIAELKSLARSIQPDLPLLVGIDQEGGSLSPLRGIVTSLPGNMGLAATGDPEAAYFAGTVTGSDLTALGFNLNFAPVLDLALTFNPVVGTRAFSDQPENTAKFGREFARGLAAAGVLFSAKHFPGHGCCTADSHVELPSCPDPMAVLAARDMHPFKAVRDIPGLALMMAHVKYAALDPDRPASLSPQAARYIRQEMGFDGVLLTDCLEMKAIQQTLPYPEDAVAAISAGMDLVLISHTPEHQEASFRAVKDAVRAGRIPIARIEEAVKRIGQWKKQLDKGLPPSGKVTEAGMDARGTARLAEQALTLYRATPVSWQFDARPLTLITPEMSKVTLAESLGELRDLEDELTDCSIRWERIRCRHNPDSAELERVIAAQRQSGNPRVVLIISNPLAAPGQVKLIAELAREAPLLLVCTRNPGEYQALNLDLPVVFTYSTEAAVLRALARVLAGKGVPGGKVPLTWFPARV